MDCSNLHRWKTFCLPHGFVYTVLIVTSLFLFIFTVNQFHHLKLVSTYSSKYEFIGFPLPHDDYLVQWTFLHFNDVYEILPLNNKENGGLARVAHIRKLLKQENSHTYSILGGDFLSPSALSTAKVNGTRLNGRQMIATLNELGLDMTIFGNHEFDLNEQDLLTRMNESNFSWIATNIISQNGPLPFGSSISHKFLYIKSIRVLIIGLTTDRITSDYVRIVNQSSVVPFVRLYLKQFPSDSYDLLVAITHFSVSIDIELAEKIPQIDLILGGHDHKNVYFVRGMNFTPIYKADANVFTVYILRFVFNLQTKQFQIYPTLSLVNSRIAEDKQTAQVAEHWFNFGIANFRESGFEPNEIVSCLPADIHLDGRRESMHSSPTLLTDVICRSMLKATELHRTQIVLFNHGAVRIDDILFGIITQYDILRTLPFANELLVLLVPANILHRVLDKNHQRFAYIGIDTLDRGKTWFINGKDLSMSKDNYTIVTIDYLRKTTEFNHRNVEIIEKMNLTQTKSLINYLKIIYPPC